MDNTKIYILNINDNYSVISEFLNILNKKELEKYKKFINKNDAINYLYSHALLKIFLSKIKKCHYKDLIFFENKYGKPYLKQGPYFSISHTQGMIGIAISNTEIGLDIENINRKIDWKSLDLMWSKSEKKYLDSINFNYDNKTCYKIWTLKESIVKSLGIGLNLSLHNIVLPIKNINNNKIIAIVNNKNLNFIRCNNLNLNKYCISIAGNKLKNITTEKIKIKDYL